jgi:hypothetical protein
VTDDDNSRFWPTWIRSTQWLNELLQVSLKPTKGRTTLLGTVGRLEHVSEVICLGCGALSPDTTGSVHAYMDASPGCWQMYCELQDWKNSLIGDNGITTAQHLVDTYAVQHATNTDRRNRQSVTVHLMSLCASLEFDMSGRQLRAMIGIWTHRDHPLLRPRPNHFPITVRNVRDVTGDRRKKIVEGIAESTWSAWSVHHSENRTLLVSYIA